MDIPIIFADRPSKILGPKIESACDSDKFPGSFFL